MHAFPLKTSLIARHELVGLGQASASASRAPRPQWAPSAVGEPFGDTSDAISRQPLRVGRVDRCWCQWHGWGASWQRDKSRRAPRHTVTVQAFTAKRRVPICVPVIGFLRNRYGSVTDFRGATVTLSFVNGHWRLRSRSSRSQPRGIEPRN